MTVSLQVADGHGPLAQSLQIRGHALTADVGVAEGGTDAGPSPHDLYDAALGACKALTVMWYARKKGMPVTDIRTVVDRDDSEERKGVYRLATRLQIGGELSDAQIQELSAVAQKCPVHKLMTAVTTEVTTHVERA
ncbi:osmotically inducible protein OsmC [Rhodoferax koreense]|uniref:Osmotically inducible protein OsmC n=1 Tax=Rhodoferax koreensis TaxID=1842727 RepID=A0A1P8JVY6_9BURK|nr:OsmC family protein [Rhodoferax koreense]APW37939.1 osmotically inducible protein OsmC [Rhodoferax koreense]